MNLNLIRSMPKSKPFAKYIKCSRPTGPSQHFYPVFHEYFILSYRCTYCFTAAIHTSKSKCVQYYFHVVLIRRTKVSRTKEKSAFHVKKMKFCRANVMQVIWQVSMLPTQVCSSKVYSVSEYISRYKQKMLPLKK